MNRSTAFEAPGNPPLPHYGWGSLADLGSSIVAALGVPGIPNTLGLPAIERACLFLVDGLGWELLREHRREAPFLNELADASPGDGNGLGGRITAGYPATTAASTASIGTGLTPGEHGVLGYTFAMPGLPVPFNALTWSPHDQVSPVGALLDRLPPEEVQPVSTLAERAEAAGIRFTFAGPAQHATSGLTRAVLRGGTYVGITQLSDDLDMVHDAVRRRSPGLTCVYDPLLDGAGHRHGVASAAWRRQLSRIDGISRDLFEGVPTGTLVAITGDHGMVDVVGDARLDVADHPELLLDVEMLAGEARARHVHVRPGTDVEAVAARWRRVLGDEAWVASRGDAIASGWFGPRVPAAHHGRIGDVVVAQAARGGIFQREVDPHEAVLVGNHGSMTSREQIVPFLRALR